MPLDKTTDWRQVPYWRRPVCTAQAACDGNDLGLCRLTRGKFLCVPCEQAIARRARLKKNASYVKGAKGRIDRDERAA